MNIQIDTNLKTIKLNEAVNLGELAKVLDKLFPNNIWKEYKLETNVVINNWSNPIIVDRWTYPTFPWWNQPYYYTNGQDFTVTSNNEGNDFTVSQGVGIYNVSLNA